MEKIKEVKLSSVPTFPKTKYEDYTREELITECLVKDKENTDIEEAYQEMLDVERKQHQEKVKELEEMITQLKDELLEALRKLHY